MLFTQKTFTVKKKHSERHVPIVHGTGQNMSPKTVHRFYKIDAYNKKILKLLDSLLIVINDQPQIKSGFVLALQPNL